MHAGLAGKGGVGIADGRIGCDHYAGWSEGGACLEINYYSSSSLLFHLAQLATEAESKEDREIICAELYADITGTLDAHAQVWKLCIAVFSLDCALGFRSQS